MIVGDFQPISERGSGVQFERCEPGARRDSLQLLSIYTHQTYFYINLYR